MMKMNMKNCLLHKNFIVRYLHPFKINRTRIFTTSLSQILQIHKKKLSILILIIVYYYYT